MENNHLSDTYFLKKLDKTLSARGVWPRGSTGPGPCVPYVLPESVCSQSATTASTSACTATAGKVCSGHKEQQGKRLPLQETVQEQAKSTPHTLEVDQVLSSCTVNKDVLGPILRVHIVANCNSISLQLTSFPILPYP